MKQVWHSSKLFSNIFRRNRKVFSIAIPIISILIFTSIHYLLHLPRVPRTNSGWKDKDFHGVVEEGDEKEIVILRWTKYFHQFKFQSPWVFREGDKCEHPDYLEKMPISCRLTYDRRYWKRSIAAIFHLWDLVDGPITVVEEMPPYHPPEQIWIYQNYEAPPPTLHIGPRDYLQGFNWTLTYRRDSDFYDPYGRVIPLTSEESSGFDEASVRNLSLKKSKLAVWIVPSCESDGKREELVKQLMEYIPIDIYGQCGNYSCPSPDIRECYQEVAKEYKFYLSFENSLCVDYITEKFFNAMASDMVPVVYSGSGYSQVAPQGSYINARDFTSPKKLADYLKYLDGNLEEYLKYFQWKRKYKAVTVTDIRIGTWCGLCQKVYKELRHKSTDKKEKAGSWRKEFGHVQNWWKSQFVPGKWIPACEEPPSFLN